MDRYRADGVVVLDPVAAEQRARRSIAAQLDVGALRDVHVVADSESVRVDVEGTVELTLLRLVHGARPFTVRVDAVARPHLRG